MSCCGHFFPFCVSLWLILVSMCFYSLSGCFFSFWWFFFSMWSFFSLSVFFLCGHFASLMLFLCLFVVICISVVALYSFFLCLCACFVPLCCHFVSVVISHQIPTLHATCHVITAGLFLLTHINNQTCNPAAIRLTLTHSRAEQPVWKSISYIVQRTL